MITLRHRDPGILEKEVKRRNTALLFVTVEKQASISVSMHASYLLYYSITVTELETEMQPYAFQLLVAVDTIFKHAW